MGVQFTRHAQLMEERQPRSLSRRMAPEFWLAACPQIERGRGEGRVLAAPMVACKKARVVTTGSAETTRPSPRDGLTVAPRSPRGPAFLPPSPATRHRKLGISTGMPGPHGLAVRDNASHELTSTSLIPARQQPHATRRSILPVQQDLAAHRSPPRVRDDRDTPLSSRRDGGDRTIDSDKAKANFWAEGIDKGDGIDNARENNFWARAVSTAI
jgi:hypothetical protein